MVSPLGACTAVAAAAVAAVRCGGRGDSAHDWLVAGCAAPSTLATRTAPDGSVVYTLSNGVASRELTHNATTRSLSTTALGVLDGPAHMVAAVAPEAALRINNVSVQVGGLPGQVENARMALFSAVRAGLPASAGGFTWIPGTRGSNPNAAWPPKGSRAEFDHAVRCSAVNASTREDDGWVIITVLYEQYDGTSGFSRRVAVGHNCSGAPLLVDGMNVAYLSLVADGYVEFQSDTEASITRSMHLADGVRCKVETPYSSGEGFAGLAAGQRYQSYLMAEIVHSTPQWDPNALGGVDRYARETTRFQRLVTPQIEQMVVYVQGICVGGNRVYPGDGNDATVGYWCYDDEGSVGMKRLIDEAKELETDMIVWGQNMNGSWRSMVGPEWNSQENTTWFSGLVSRAHNTSGGQHPVEMGVYQLLLNARSASALNQAAPGNAIDLPAHWFDAMDPSTRSPDQNGGKSTCKGGPSCASLCAGTSFYQSMKTTMLEFWRTAKLSAVDQDGSRYMPCSNASHAQHHGAYDSMRVQFEEVRALFRTYLDIPGSFPSNGGVPKVAFVTSASQNFLEAGQTKVPGGYNEYVWSLPRWHWIDLQRVLIIRGVNALANVQRYYPVPWTAPYHDVQFNADDPVHWKPCYGYQTNATLTPLEEHLSEVNWVLSQTFGTGIMAQLRSRFLYDGPKSKALLGQWIAWFRKYQGILSQDFVTLALTTNCVNETQPTMRCSLDPSTGIDAIIHHGSPGIRSDFSERAMVMVWNPSQFAFTGPLTAPLYYSGLTHAAGVRTVGVSYEGATPDRVPLAKSDSVDLKVQLGPRELTWIVITA